MANTETNSWISKTAEASKKLDKYQIIGGLALIGYGFITAATGPIGWGIGLAGSSIATNYAADRIIEWDKKRQLKKSGTLYKRPSS